MTSSDLNLLVSTNLNLSELYKLKEFSKYPPVVNEHSYNNLNVIEPIPSTSSNQTDLINFESVTDAANEKVFIYEVPSLVPPVNENSAIIEEELSPVAEEQVAIEEEQEVLEIGLDHQG